LKVCVLILNYNNFSDTIKCLINLNQVKTNLQISTVVIDNNSTDGSREQLIEKEKIMDYKLLCTFKNGGYAFGNNIGISYSIEKHFDFTVILNNDIHLDDFTIDKLVYSYMGTKNTGILGPVVCDYESKIVQSAGAVNNMYIGKGELLHSGETFGKLNNSKKSPDYISGACMLISNKVLACISRIPENYFLFYEENEWCLRVRKYGLKVRCDNNVMVQHKHSATINKISGLSEYFMIRNQVIFINRNASLIPKIFFNMYTILKCFKRLLTEKNGKRYFVYYLDGLRGINRYEYLAE